MRNALITILAYAIVAAFVSYGALTMQAIGMQQHWGYWTLLAIQLPAIPVFIAASEIDRRRNLWKTTGKVVDSRFLTPEQADADITWLEEEKRLEEEKTKERDA